MNPFEGEMKNVSCVWSIVIACLCYCHFISGKLGKGKWRLTSLLPIFYIFTLLPLYTSSFVFTFVTASFITWFSSFKLLLFTFDQGPIVPKSLPIFIATAALPFNFNIEPKKPMKLPLNLATEITICVLLFHDYKRSFQFHSHSHIVLVTYCYVVFLLLQILLKLSTLPVEALMGMEAGAPSDEPFLATSLREFWGRRWNLPVNALLRQAVYEPVRSAAAAVMGGETAKQTGVIATFVVSGLSHELLFWYIVRAPPSWEMTMFFVVNGVFVVVEIKMAVAGWKMQLLPWFVAWPVTVGFVVWTSSWLFFPPVMRNGVDVRLTREIRFVMEGVKGVSQELVITCKWILSRIIN